MRQLLSRLVVTAASLAFSASFFLPAVSDRTPVKVLKGIAETASSLENRVAAVMFFALAVVMAYPYVWALLLASAAAFGRKHRFLENRWIHLVFHAAGGMLVAAVGITMLVIRDTWIPIPAQWAAATVPFVVLSVMMFVVLSVERTSGVWVIAALGFLPHVPVQFLLARMATGMDEAPWGFIMGGSGAAAVVIGSLCLIFFRLRAREAA